SVLVVLASSAAADVAAVPTSVASATPSSGASEPGPAVSVVASATHSGDSDGAGDSGASRGRGLGCGDSPGLRNPATLRRLPGGRFELGLLREDDNTRSVSASASLVIGVRVLL